MRMQPTLRPRPLRAIRHMDQTANPFFAARVDNVSAAFKINPAHLISCGQVAILRYMDKSFNPVQSKRGKMLRGSCIRQPTRSWSRLGCTRGACLSVTTRVILRTAPAGPRCCANCSGMRALTRRSSRLSIVITVPKSRLVCEFSSTSAPYFSTRRELLSASNLNSARATTPAVSFLDSFVAAVL